MAKELEAVLEPRNDDTAPAAAGAARGLVAVASGELVCIDAPAAPASSSRSSPCKAPLRSSSPPRAGKRASWVL